MDRVEVRALLGLSIANFPQSAHIGHAIAVDDSLNEEYFLKTLEETLRQHIASLSQQFLVLSAVQVDRLAFRLHDALVPKRDAETRVIQAWTIQPHLQLKIKSSAHLQVLKLSTILREVQMLRLHQSETEETHSPIEIEIFPSLRVIEMLNMKPRGLQNVHCFAYQLRELHIEHTQMTTLRQLLAPNSKPWRKLTKLRMKCCELQVLDESVNMLKSVKVLDLGWNKITKVMTDINTRSLEVLSLCHNQLYHVPPIKSLRSLRELDLAVNQISSLKGLETLTALERLDVSHNVIHNITEVEHLTRLSRLMSLKIEFNPIAKRPDYRREVLFYLSERIELDGKRWSDVELRSMKNMRMLMMLNGMNGNIGHSTIWRQTAEDQVYPKARVQSGLNLKSSTLVLGYPLLPPNQSVSANCVTIQKLSSTLPTKSDCFKKATASGAESGESFDKKPLSRQSSRATRLSAQTVDDYFRTQRDDIGMRGRNESDNRVKDSEMEASNEFDTRAAQNNLQTYGASGLKCNFEKKSQPLAGGPASKNGDDNNVLQSTPQIRTFGSQIFEQSISVRVLLTLKEATELGLCFSDDGVPATVKVKSQNFFEQLSVCDGKDPIIISRWLQDVITIGTSFDSSRAKTISITLLSRRSTSVVSVAYQFDSIALLEKLLLPLFACLYQQYKSRVVGCNCIDCGAISLFTPKFLSRTHTDDASIVFKCLLCSSCNVREMSSKKLEVICASEGINISSCIPLAPPPWELMTEGFYIEELVPTENNYGAGMEECTLYSCNGIREAASTSDEQCKNDELRTKKINDAILHAMTTTM
ncbi:hypothetical protein CCR75_004248 [Bremia lactucae]|uniref:Serine/threonine-protein kinase 11-interacting protein n=1 Tax=Bremia lactucae TaxID=4779 RepID=A0A976FIB9_BRELC|nr:hypothetical protein CCR75_004248 [Bremia lactucae]